MKARAIATAMLVACATAFALSGCAPTARVGASSPHAIPERADIVSSSDLTEQSQLVELSIPFDGDVETTGDALDDLSITLDGDALNDRTTQASASSDGHTLFVRLSPTAEAEGVDSPLYFACYQGKLEVSAHNPSGALPHVMGPEGAAAVLDGAVSCTIPSGMRIEQVSSEPGKTVVEVTRFAQIRCCTWFDIGGERVFVHHHRFAQESERTCAEALAEAVNHADIPYSAEAEGALVAITADGSAGAEGTRASFDVSIVEGVGR